MKKSDLMGRFAFDGAEGIAFWIGDSDTEPITKVMFDELETLKAFIEHNLPGMFGAPEPEWQESRGILHSNGLLEAGVTLPPGQLVKVRRRKAGPWEVCE